MDNFDEIIKQYTVKEVNPKTGEVAYIFKHTNSRMRYIDIREPRKIIKKPREPFVRKESTTPKKIINPPERRYKKFKQLKIEDNMFNSVEEAAMHYHVNNNTIYVWIYRGINGTERIY